MCHSLSEIYRQLETLKTLDPVGNKAKVYSLADEAIKVTLDEKLMSASSLESLTEDLAKLIELFPCDVPLDDLRYRLAHLYMRCQKWQEADNQLLELKEESYYNTEAQIYSALCAFKLGTKPNINEIAERLKSSKLKLRSKSTQEQCYDLLEMFVYASNLDYSDLGTYYKRGSTKANLEVRFYDKRASQQDNPSWLPMAKFRFLDLLKYCKDNNFLILDLTDRGVKEAVDYTTKIRPEGAKKIAEILAIDFPSSISIENLKDKLESYCNSRDRSKKTISEWKGILNESIEQLSGQAEAVTQTDSKYKLNHSFLLIQKRQRH